MKTINKFNIEQIKPNMIVIAINSEGIYLQSYGVIIAGKTLDGVVIDKSYWDYSQTTGKHRNEFLNETKKETQAKIDSGEYKLVDLN